MDVPWLYNSLPVASTAVTPKYPPFPRSASSISMHDSKRLHQIDQIIIDGRHRLSGSWIIKFRSSDPKTQI